MTDITSTGMGTVASSYGKTCRQNVLGRVYISVMQSATGRALPRPNRERKFVEQMSAVATGLRTGIPAADRDYSSIRTISFVLNHLSKCRPASISNRFRETPVFHKTSDVQILQDQGTVITDKLRRSLMQKISACGSYFSMSASDLLPGLFLILRSFLTPRHPSLIARKVLLFALQVPRIGDLFAVAGNCKIFDSEINSDSGLIMCQRTINPRIARKRDVPTSIRIKRDGQACYFKFYKINVWPRPDKLQWFAELSEPNLSILFTESRSTELSALPTSSAFKPGIFAHSIKKCRKSRLLISQSLLQGHGRHFIQPRKFRLLFDGSEKSARFCKRGTRASACISLVSPCQSFVPYNPDATKSAAQQRFLFSRRVNPAFVSRAHDPILSEYSVSDKAFPLDLKKASA